MKVHKLHFTLSVSIHTCTKSAVMFSETAKLKQTPLARSTYMYLITHKNTLDDL